MILQQIENFFYQNKKAYISGLKKLPDGASVSLGDVIKCSGSSDPIPAGINWIESFQYEVVPIPNELTGSITSVKLILNEKIAYVPEEPSKLDMAFLVGERILNKGCITYRIPRKITLSGLGAFAAILLSSFTLYLHWADYQAARNAIYKFSVLQDKMEISSGFPDIFLIEGRVIWPSVLAEHSIRDLGDVDHVIYLSKIRNRIEEIINQKASNVPSRTVSILPDREINFIVESRYSYKGDVETARSLYSLKFDVYINPPCSNKKSFIKIRSAVFSKHIGVLVSDDSLNQSIDGILYGYKKIDEIAPKTDNCIDSDDLNCAVLNGPDSPKCKKIWPPKANNKK